MMTRFILRTNIIHLDLRTGNSEGHPGLFIRLWDLRTNLICKYEVSHLSGDDLSNLSRQEVHPVTTRTGTPWIYSYLALRYTHLSTGVWFQESVRRMFNTARIPQRECDILSATSLSSDPLSYNVVVIVNNWFYTLRAYDYSSSSERSKALISAETFLSRLNAIVCDATTRPGLAPEIGVLSADDRDIWASVSTAEPGS